MATYLTHIHTSQLTCVQYLRQPAECPGVSIEICLLDFCEVYTGRKADIMGDVSVNYSYLESHSNIFSSGDISWVAITRKHELWNVTIGMCWGLIRNGDIIIKVT